MSDMFDFVLVATNGVEMFKFTLRKDGFKAMKHIKITVSWFRLLYIGIADGMSSARAQTRRWLVLTASTRGFRWRTANGRLCTSVHTCICTSIHVSIRTAS